MSTQKGNNVIIFFIVCISYLTDMNSNSLVLVAVKTVELI